MTSTEFKIAWEKRGEKLITLPKDQLDELGLNDATVYFLTEAGLPEEAAPLLTFLSSQGGSGKRIRIVTEDLITRHSFSEGGDLGPEFAAYVSIGTDGNGNIVAINTAQSDQIECLDHENRFASIFMNSSVQSMAEFLMHYSNFIDLIIQENGEDAFLDSNFSAAQVHSLRMNMTKTDKKATEIGFWLEELNNLEAEVKPGEKKPWWKFF